MFEHIRTTWDHRGLIWSFALRDVKARYKQTVLGIAWAMLQPLSMMVVFTCVFSWFAKVPSDGLPYHVFAYSGLLFWTFFSTVIGQGTVAMVANSSLIRKIYFPRETLLIATLIAASIDLLTASTIFLAMLLYYKMSLTVAMAWVLPLLFLEVLFAFGVVCLTSAVHVNFRDIGHVLPLMIQLWMFATPVAYPISVIPDWFRPVYMLNPMAPIIDGYRRVILHGTEPDLTALAVSFGFVVVVAVGGFAIFKRAERTFADVI